MDMTSDGNAHRYVFISSMFILTPPPGLWFLVAFVCLFTLQQFIYWVNSDLTAFIDDL